MAGRQSRFPKALLVSVGLVVAAAVVLLASVRLVHPPPAPPPSSAAQPTIPDEEPAIPELVPEPEPPPPPPPPPPPEPEPVVGTTEVVEIVDLSTSGTGVFREGTDDDAPVPVDEGAVASFAEAIGAWFDAHLADLQRGGGGTIAALAGGPFDPLADPQHLVDDVEYRMRIGARGEPEWAEVTARVSREDDVVSVVLAVAPGEEEPVLVAASPPRSETGETAVRATEANGTVPPASATIGSGL